MTAPAPISVASISRQETCVRLGIGERRLRALLRIGRLEETGRGHAKRILLSSLTVELERRAKEIRNSRDEKAEFFGNLPDAVPNFCDRRLDEKTISGDPVSEMIMRMPMSASARESQETLLSLSRAAAIVGVSDTLMRQLVASGDVPAVQVGSRQRINANVLRAWSRGELERQQR